MTFLLRILGIITTLAMISAMSILFISLAGIVYGVLFE